jgi:hypothetical protein
MEPKTQIYIIIDMQLNNKQTIKNGNWKRILILFCI